MSERRASVVLELENRIGGPLRRLSRQVKRETASVRRSFAGVTRQLRHVGTGFGIVAGAGVAAVTKLTTDVASSGDEIAKLSGQLGIGVEALQKYRFAAERMGVSQNTLDKSLEAFSRRLGDAKNGTGALTTYLKKANPELLQQLKTTDSLEKAFHLYLRAIESTEDPTVAAAGAAAAFSRQGMVMVRMTRDGMDNIDALMQRAEDLGLVLSEKTARDAEAFQDSLTDMQGAMGGVRNILGGALLPAISQIMDQITTGVVENAQTIRAWSKQFASALPGNIEVIKQELIRVKDIVITVRDMLGGWRNLFYVIAGISLLPLVTSLLNFAAALVLLGGKLKLVTAAQWLLNAALVANPVGLVVTAVAGLIAILMSMGVTLEDVKGWFKDAVSYCQSIMTGWVESLKTSWDSAVAYIRERVAAIKNLVPEWMRNTISSGANAVSSAANAGTAAVSSVWGRVRGAVGLGDDQAGASPPGSSPTMSRRPATSAQDARVGGLIRIEIDGSGRPRVKGVEKQGPVDLDVDSGPLMLRGG